MKQEGEGERKRDRILWMDNFRFFMVLAVIFYRVSLIKA